MSRPEGPDPGADTPAQTPGLTPPAENWQRSLEAAFTRGGVQLVIVPIDYSENLRVLVEELRDQA